MPKQILRRPEPFWCPARKTNLCQINECSRLVAIQAKGRFKFRRGLPLAAQLQENCAIVVARLGRIWRNMGGRSKLAISLLQFTGVVGENSEIGSCREILGVRSESAPKQSPGPGRITTIHPANPIHTHAGGLFLNSSLLAVAGRKL